MQQTVAKLEGAYALAAIDTQTPDTVVGARKGSPLVVGVGIGENFLASDTMALRQVTDRFIYLEEADLVCITPASVQVYSADGREVKRPITRLKEGLETADMGDFDHYMIKEIFEQPEALEATFAGAINAKRLRSALALPRRLCSNR